MTSELAFPDVVDFQEGPGIMARDFRDAGVPLVRLAGMTSASSLLDGCNYLDPEMVEKRWSHFRLQQGDTLISTSASLGRVARVTKDASGAIAYTGIIRLRPRDGRLVSDFIQYVVAGQHFQDQIEAMGAGSVMPHFGPSHLQSMTLMVPSPDEQRRIAWVLGAIDAKIDSNRRLAAILEESAAAAFRGRFVDFVGGDHFYDTPTGRMPQGWRSGVLGDLASIAKGSISPSKTPTELFEHYSIPAYDNGRAPHLAPGAEILSNKTVLPSRDCVLLSKLNPGTTRRVWWPRPTGAGLAVSSPEFLALVPLPGIPASYLYALLTTDDGFYDDLLGRVTGTTGSRQRVRPADVMACRVAIPHPVEMSIWDDLARPLYDHAHRTMRETSLLAALREAVLPNLISGQVHVPDGADSAAAAAAVDAAVTPAAL